MTAALLAAAFLIGAALGAAHFLSLWWSVGLMRDGRTGLGVALQGLRFFTLAAALVVVAKLGASLLLAAAAGVLVARLALTRHYRRLA
ncbi:F1F0 ATPase subunit 2 [Roseiarcus fermentans]|uniref:F1F0 ATPase subunit 2 n=1 Tax=Roseiarcus fermentans TaxID=1473586 RepID=A0A366F4X1_9HYPH|nr:ATP synthase subunit I [Roseiarcus fermentans]RBP09691.1 F1F0 ATPase subunit 2 [Roseiarcus fermentans]